LSTLQRMLAGLTIAGLAAVSAHESPDHQDHQQRVNHAAAGWPVEPFTLTDQRGQAFAHERLQGQWTFVVVGGTRCGTPCTDALSALAGLYRRVGATQVLKTTQVLFVSLDPQRDGPQRLRDFLSPYDPRFIGATAAPPVLARLADDLTVSRNPRDETGRTPSPRPSAIVLVGPDGSVRAEYLPPYDVLLLTADYLKTRLRK
jgi:protein SCO1/2